MEVPHADFGVVQNGRAHEASRVQADALGADSALAEVEEAAIILVIVVDPGAAALSQRSSSV